MKKLFGLFSKTDKSAFWICLSISVILLVSSFILPPMGVIDSSVLTAVGELFAFASIGVAIGAVARGADLNVKRGETEITIENVESEKE